MRDLQKDLEIAYRLPEKVGLVYTGKDVVVAGIDAQSMEERGLVMDWFDAAREGWPEAIKRALAAEARIKKLEAVVEAAKVLAKWMQWWLDENLCECDGIHTCGRTQREQELNKFRQALAELEEGYN
jgi:hypothetical protein